MKIWIAFLFATLIVFANHGLAQNPKTLGIDANYLLEMETRGRTWKDPTGTVDPFELFAKSGCRDVRIRLWVGDEGVGRLNYATQVARRASRCGLKSCLVIFLSDDWADMVKQPVPAVWKNLETDQKLEVIEAYSESVVRHFAKAGIVIDTYEIGNEIDFGICGEFEEEWPKRVSIEYMRTRVWPRMVPMIKAAQSGVLKAQHDAKFVVHLAQWNQVDYCISFWKTIEAAGVQIDIPGLSYFPSSAKDPQQRSLDYLCTQTAKIVEGLKKPVMICETGYPARSEFGGQFAEWNLPADGYPLTDDGQAKWITDFASKIRNNPSFAGAFYWSPEWYDGGLWDAFALFDQVGQARPGIRLFTPELE